MRSLAVLFVMFVAPALNALGQQPEGKKPEKPSEPSEIRVLTLKHHEAIEVASTLGQLFQERNVRVASHKPSNTILVVGPSDKLRLVEAVVAKLDERGTKKQKGEIKIVFLKNAQAGEMASTLQQVFQEMGVRIIADPRSNSVLLSGALDELEAVVAVIGRLDEKTEKQPANPGN